MTIREETEAIERQTLSSCATLSANSLGRRLPLTEDPIRPCFQRDRDRILHSKAFRRLKQKTQVFLSPEGDHYRTRLTHTLEVSQIARTVSRALRLNEDLTEAIALGHDLGHTPFGHAGERMLAQLMPEGFAHYQQSVRVVDRLEKNGQGLNLTWEVRNGILCHTKGEPAATLEGQVVRLADHIAYINHDIDDAMRAGILTNDDIPRPIAHVLGETHKDRINTLVTNTISHTIRTGELSMDPEVAGAMRELRSFMFQRVYRNPVAKGEESKAKVIVQQLYAYYICHPQAMPDTFQPQLTFEGMERTVCDYIAGMTDKYAVDKYTELFIPSNWHVRG